MNYLVIDISPKGLVNWAILFGKFNIEKVDSNEFYNLYKIQYQNITFWIPESNSPSRQFKVTHLKFIYQYWPELENSTKIVSLPDKISRDSDNEEDSFIEYVRTIYPPDTIYLHLQFRGDPAQAAYTQSSDNNVKYISSSAVAENSYKKTNHLHLYDLKLCIPFFYYKHSLSLANPKYLESFQSKSLMDKVFIYGRRMDEIESQLRNRRYFLNKMNSILPDEMVEYGNLFTMELEGQTVSLGLYHFGNYIDYNSCMFNVVNESINVDSLKNRHSCWISEKSVFAIMFATPIFLLANQEILETYRDMGIVLLNDEFYADDIGDRFEMFCNFIKDSTPQERNELYTKHRIIQNRNREIMLDYINSPKINCIEYLIN
jgi:hypothetical protein